jgi:hypothetical protein
MALDRVGLMKSRAHPSGAAARKPAARRKEQRKVHRFGRRYGHRHPDHLKGARDTLDRRPGRGYRPHEKAKDEAAN